MISLFNALALNAKSFVPFQYAESTVLFAVTFVLGAAGSASTLIREIRELRNIIYPLFMAPLLFSICLLSWMTFSKHDVRITYYLGMLGVCGAFYVMGIATSRNPKPFAIMLVTFSVVYFVLVGRSLLRDGSLYATGLFDDIFDLQNVELRSGSSFTQLYQNVGQYLALGVLAFWYLFGLRNPLSWLVLAGASVLIVMAQARGAILGLIFGTLVFVFSGSRARFAPAAGIVGGAVVLVGVFLFGDWLIGNVPLIRRTISEINAPPQGSRWELWAFAAKELADPTVFLFGRGFGMFSFDFTQESPDWLIASDRIVAYPHNAVIEALYDLGIGGAVIYLLIWCTPFFLHRQLAFRGSEGRFALALYTYFAWGEMVSGSIAYAYPFYFAYGFALGMLREHNSSGLQEYSRQPQRPSQLSDGCSAPRARS